MISSIIRQELVLIGGGHAHLQVLRSFAMNPLKDLRITVVSKEVYAYYSGMVPGYMAGHYRESEIRVDLAMLCAACGASLIWGEVHELDVPERKVKIQGRPDLHFDLLSINAGSSTTGPQSVGEKSFSVRPAGQFLSGLEGALNQLKGKQPVNIVVIGAGAAGVETALALEYRMRTEPDIEQHRVTLVTATEDCPAGYDKKIQGRIIDSLHRNNIRLVTSFKVSEADSGQIKSEQGATLEYDTLFWATPATSQPWFQSSGLAVDGDGFILIDEYLACIGLTGVFAAGDAATMLHVRHPKAGVYAVRQGAVLARNIRRKLLGLRLHAYKPQRDFLTIISLGEKTALAVRKRLFIEGRLAWYWKDWIDRRFLKKFTRLFGTAEKMTLHKKIPGVIEYGIRTAPLPRHHCGGCAAKINSKSLNRVLERLGIPTGSITQVKDDASVIKLADSAENGDQLLQSIDGFRAILPDPWVSARITAAHAFNDIYAMGVNPSNVLAWVVIPWSRPKLTEEALFQTMSGLLATCQESEVKLIGGHSSEGPELSIGLAVTGFSAEPLWQKGGASIGDVLMVTKPVGAGVLFAAHMLGKCPGEWLFGAIKELVKTHAKALDILRKYTVSSCTDISGFGLLGHAVEMAVASRHGFLIRANDVPVLNGSLRAFGAGLESSLQSANEQVLRSVHLTELSGADERVKALIDPMTSGGLLFSLPPNEATDCLKNLQKQDYSAAIIGEVIAEDGGRVHLTPSR